MLLSQVLKLQVFLKHTEAATRDVLLKLQVFLKHIEAATRGVLWKKVFLEISQNSQEITCARYSCFYMFQEYLEF